MKQVKRKAVGGDSFAFASVLVSAFGGASSAVLLEAQSGMPVTTDSHNAVVALGAVAGGAFLGEIARSAKMSDGGRTMAFTHSTGEQLRLDVVFPNSKVTHYQFKEKM